MAKSAKRLPSWRNSIIRKKGERVSAASAEDAIKVAIREYGITDHERQRRLVAQRIEA